jgi:hypothetical protein
MKQNKAGTVPNDTGLQAPTPRGSLPNSLGDTCIPIRPFRCWQYRKGEPVPEWVLNSDLRHQPESGIWFVEEQPGRVYLYTPAEFQERFRVEAP